MIRVVLPYHLRMLAHVESDDVELQVGAPVTLKAVIDAIESAYPMLTGTIRDHGASKRRPWLRFFACGQDISNEPLDAPLPDVVADGEEPLFVVGAIAGG